MHDLNPQQVILLCLLVTFVTSIATGITTVSLLEQAPDPVVQTINRVVERTVERVVPDAIDEPNVTVEKTPEKEIVTVVVKEEDLTVDSVKSNSPSLVRIYYSSVSQPEQFVALGVVVSKEGRIITDRSVRNTYKGGLYAKQGGESYPLNFVDIDSPILALFDMETETERSFIPATFGDSAKLQLAQSVISLSGTVKDTVSTGIITSLDTVTTEEGGDEVISTIATSVNQSNVQNGSILLNLQGSIVGMKISSHSAGVTTFMPSNALKAFIEVGQ